MQAKIEEARAILRAAIDAYHPVAIFALFSGGHDSLTSTSLAFSLIGEQITAAVHIQTGTGIPQTFQFVQDTCAAQDWPLKIYQPPLDRETGEIGAQYRQMVLSYGFPGKGAHLFPYVLLKERALNQLVREHKQRLHDRVMLITGVRKQESQRRMGHVQAIKRDGAALWIAPLVHWSAEDCAEWIAEQRLKRNEVADLLHLSGECLCGAFAKPGELDEIARWYPETAAHIRTLEEEAKACGQHCRWGTPLSQNEVMRRHLAKTGMQQMELPLCHSCMKGDSDD